MSLFAISDLHLSFGTNKPMDIFDTKWENHYEKIKENWLKNITAEDTVLLPGDFSWGTYLEDSFHDFSYLNELPGRKILLKGNHDYWWTTLNKLNKFIKENNFSNIEFLHNNTFIYKDYIICGTRGWTVPSGLGTIEEDKKIYNRELIRLELSLKETQQYQENKIIVCLHFPPIRSKGESTEILDLMKKYNVKMCIYGHLHGNSIYDAKEGNYDNIDYKLVSCEYIDFNPIKILD